MIRSPRKNKMPRKTNAHEPSLCSVARIRYTGVSFRGMKIMGGL